MPADQNAASRGLGRLLSRVAPIEPREVPAVVAAFCLFFCVFAGYFAVRPVRETIGTVLGKERVADIWVITWIASLAIIPVYGYLIGKFRRSVLLPSLYGGIAVSLALVGVALQADEQNIVVGRFFYVFISVLNLFIVSVFWSFLLELFSSGRASGCSASSPPAAPPARSSGPSSPISPWQELATAACCSWARSCSCSR
jgi:AAA family ATP:ADP antiporter